MAHIELAALLRGNAMQTKHMQMTGMTQPSRMPHTSTHDSQSAMFDATVHKRMSKRRGHLQHHSSWRPEEEAAHAHLPW